MVDEVTAELRAAHGEGYVLGYRDASDKTNESESGRRRLRIWLGIAAVAAALEAVGLVSAVLLAV